MKVFKYKKAIKEIKKRRNITLSYTIKKDYISVDRVIEIINNNIEEQKVYTYREFIDKFFPKTKKKIIRHGKEFDDLVYREDK